MKSLIIVESPTKARTLSQFLGGDYQIEATMGHVRDLPKKKLAIDTDHDFKPDYIIMPDKEEIVNKLKQEKTQADNVILATDPDREGEAIAYHVAYLLSDGQPLKRIVFHEITENAVKEALANPREIDMKLVDAQQARRILDRLVGYKLSPLLWRKVRRGLSAGRVQSVAVRLIVEREREIEAFKAEEYWTIQAELRKSQSSDNQTPVFLASFISRDENKVEIKNQEEANQLVGELGNLNYKVREVRVEETHKSPYPPFTTSTMQQAASILFGWTSKRTMQVAQGLYEQGLITYHRTDSVNLSEQAIGSVRDFIEKEFGKNYLPELPRIYKTKSKVAQEAHEAIRPTNVNRRPDDLVADGKRDGKKLYELIWKRFLTCQMADAVYEETKVDISATKGDAHLPAEYLFRASGSKLKFDGWKRLSGDDREEENVFPPLSTGDLLELVRLLPTQHFTEPPARFNEASLIKALEEKGIGRPSTYAPIISTIQERQYVEKTDRKFSPTILGKTVNDFLVENFPEIVDVDFTAKMEDNLDSIANGESKWVPVISEFYEPFSKTLDKTKDVERVKIPVEQTDEICDECGAPLVIRIGRFGKFLACSRFPDCKFTKTLVNKTEFKCPKCGGDVIIKKTKRGKTFYGCSNYPNCTFAAWKKEDIINPKPEQVDNKKEES